MPKVFYWMCSKSGFKHLKSISFIPLEYSFGKLPGEIFDWTFHNFATHATNQYTSWITCHSQGLLVRFVKKKPLFLWLSFTFYFSFCLISNKNLIIAVSISVPMGPFKYILRKQKGGWVGYAKCLRFLTRWAGGSSKMLT